MKFTATLLAVACAASTASAVSLKAHVNRLVDSLDNLDDVDDVVDLLIEHAEFHADEDDFEDLLLEAFEENDDEEMIPKEHLFSEDMHGIETDNDPEMGLSGRDAVSSNPDGIAEGKGADELAESNEAPHNLREVPNMMLSQLSATEQARMHAEFNPDDLEAGDDENVDDTSYLKSASTSVDAVPEAHEIFEPSTGFGTATLENDEQVGAGVAPGTGIDAVPLSQDGSGDTLESNDPVM